MTRIRAEFVSFGCWWRRLCSRDARSAASVALVAFAVVVTSCAGSESAQPQPSAVNDRVVEIGTTTADADPTPASNATADDVVITHPPVRTRSDEAEGDGVQPEGFPTVAARITSATGDVCDVCLWLADNADARAQGLKGVTDLGGPVGMAFSWEETTVGRFYMLDTPTPLSIAWFHPDGTHLSETDMEPCMTDDADSCPRYESGGEYRIAIEMLQGELGVVGIGPGASVELLDAAPDTCAFGA